MKLFNKYETIGILASVGIMALTLVAVRLKTENLFVNTTPEKGTQSAVVAVSQEDGDDEALANALKDASSNTGDLVELVIDDVRIGTGAGVKDGDTVSVHYIGTTQDGVRFDSSYERGQPFEFTVGTGKVIQGWEKGLIGMQVGGQRILVIPGAMAYGNRQVGPIPPNAPLVFAVELLEIR